MGLAGIYLYLPIMFRNYLIIAIRYLLKNKVFSIINILGLSLGMAFTIIVFLWIQDELNYDTFHAKHDRVYHAYLRVLDARTSFNFQPSTSHEIGKAMLDDIPEIIDMARMSPLGEIACTRGDNMFIESGGFGADPEFFNLFTYPLVDGSSENALNGLYSIVLTEQMARKYFGESRAVGQTMRINNRLELTVTGVIKDVPVNSHHNFDFLVPFDLSSEYGNNIEEMGNLYGNCLFNTYVLLQENANHDTVLSKVTRQFRIEDDGFQGETFLVPLPKTNRFSLIGGNLLIYIFFVVGILVLIIACINFMNLSTAKATIRVKEVGIRKVFGASRQNLFRQFMGETFLYALISLNFAVILASLFMPVLNNLTGKEIRLNYLEPSWIGILFAIWLFTSFSAGSYPALLLASKIPSSIFQQQQQAWSGRSITRTILVTSQFVFATIFLITVIVVNRQFHYMDHADLGYRKQDLVYLRLRDQPREMSEIIKHDLLQIPGITSITNTSHLPVLVAGGFYEVWGRSDEEARYLATTSVDYDYVKTIGVEMKEGRFYSRHFSTDSISAVVVNETALEQMGLESGTGERFLYRGEYYNIIGVMKDFHHVPLILKITPVLFRLQPAGNDYILLRIGSSDAADMSRILEQITSTWKQNFPELPLEYNFLEDYEFPQERVIYSAERLMRYFTILAILISSMGLFGLSTFMAERKTKEIGIRKVMGASIERIIRIFSREYLKLIILANLIAWPLAWLLMKQFLTAFAYRTKISPWIFLVVGIFVYILAIITVGVQAYRSALRNPADTLRYE